MDWQADGSSQIPDGGKIMFTTFRITPPVGMIVQRTRLGVEVTTGSQKFGQQAEALNMVGDDEK